jgi:hypothetical protein
VDVLAEYRVRVWPCVEAADGSECQPDDHDADAHTRTHTTENTISSSRAGHVD